MMLEIAIVVLFVLALAILSFLSRKSTLEKLSLLEEEKILFEESGIRVEQKGSPSVSVYPNCTIRVTSRRIIVSQAVLWRKKVHALKFVFQYGNEEENLETARSLKKGYMMATIHPSRVTLLGERVRIDIPESLLTRHQYLQFFTRHPNEYWTLFHRS